MNSISFVVPGNTPVFTAADNAKYLRVVALDQGRAGDLAWVLLPADPAGCCLLGSGTGLETWSAQASFDPTVISDRIDGFYTISKCGAQYRQPLVPYD